MFVCTVRSGDAGLLPMRVWIQERSGELEVGIAIDSQPARCDPRVLTRQDAERLRDWLISKLQ
jgi:hypothetical protein